MTFLQGRVGCLWIVSCSIVSMNPAEMISKQMPGGERVGEILPGGDHRKKKKKQIQIQLQFWTNNSEPVCGRGLLIFTVFVISGSILFLFLLFKS